MYFCIIYGSRKIRLSYVCTITNFWINLFKIYIYIFIFKECQTDENTLVVDTERLTQENEKVREKCSTLEKEMEMWKEEYKHLKLQNMEKDSLITDLSNALATRDSTTDAALEEIPEEDEHTDEEEVAYI